MSSIESIARPTEKRLVELQKLVRLVSDLNRYSLDLDRMLQASLEGIRDIIGESWGFLFLLDSATHACNLANVIGLDENLIVELNSLKLDPEMQSNSLDISPHSSLSKLATRVASVLDSHQLPSRIVIPLVSGKLPMGILVIGMPTDHVPEPPSVDLLMAIGEQMGRAIDNANLHAKLREAEAWSHAFIENSPDGIIERNAQGVVTYANDAACRIMECTREELVATPFTDWIVDSVQPSPFRDRLRQTGVISAQNIKVQTKRGTRKLLSYTARTVKNGQGETVSFQTITRDVTDYYQSVDDLRKRNEELAALNAIAEILSHPLELSSALTQVCEQITDITHMDTVGVILNDPDLESTRLVAHSGLSEQLIKQFARLGLDDLVTRQIVTEGQVVGWNDISQYQGDGLAGPRDEGYHAVVFVPIIQQDKQVGSLGAGSKTLHAYEQSHVNLLTNVSRQIARALENSELYAKMQERMAELDGLAQLSAASTVTLDPVAVANIAVDWTATLLKGDACALRRIEGDAWILDASHIHQGITHLEERIPVHPIFYNMIQNRVPLVVHDIETSKEMDDAVRLNFLQHGIRALAIAPMIVRDRTIGGLAVMQAQSRQWTPREIELLQTIANQVTTVVENARLFQRVMVEQAKVQAIFDSGLSGLYATDLQGRMVMFNHVAERITGWKMDDVFGKTWNQVFCCSDELPIEPLINEALVRKQTAFVMDGRRMTTRDGRIILVSEAVAPLLNDQGQVTGAVGAFWDLTREKQAEISQQEVLTQVAHQLRSPLTAVLSTLEMMENPRLPKARRHEMWEMIKRDAERLRVFANEFLDHQATVRSNRELRLEPLSIAVVARDMIERTRALAQRHQFEFACINPEPVVLADANATQDVLRNLLDNAVRYSPEGTTVTLAIQALNDSMVDISVNDEGPGIALQDLDQVFRPFYRASTSSQRPQYSHGLGLWIAKQAVEKMDGQIWISPSHTHGTTIHFTLRRSA